MKRNDRKRSEWRWPSTDWWFGLGGWNLMLFAMMGLSIVGMKVLLQLSQWSVHFPGAVFSAGVAIALLGATLIFHAKVPLYRQRRFFTWGSKALLETRRPYYRWGYVGVAAGCGLLVVMLLRAV
jgi:hypothetical protein